MQEEVRALLDRYVRILDDDRLEEWPSLFTEDGFYRIATRENHEKNLPLSVMECRGHAAMAGRILDYRRVNVFESHRYLHQVSGVEIQTAGPRVAHVRSNFLVVRTQAGSEAMSLFAAGVYADIIHFTAAGAKFMQRLVIEDGRQGDGPPAIPL